MFGCIRKKKKKTAPRQQRHSPVVRNKSEILCGSAWPILLYHPRLVGTGALRRCGGRRAHPPKECGRPCGLSCARITYAPRRTLASLSGPQYFILRQVLSGSCYAASEQTLNIWGLTRRTFSVPCQRRQAKHQQATYVCGL